MATDEEKARLAKLLKNVEVPETKISERCSDLVKEFQKKFDGDVDESENIDVEQKFGNPYVVDKELIEETERKLKLLLAENKRNKNEVEAVIRNSIDPKRPWRTNSSQEKLLRVDLELKRHHDKNSDAIPPLSSEDMKTLVMQCRHDEEGASAVSQGQLRETIDGAKRNLPNFQYSNIENSTATSILPDAHEDGIQQNKLVIVTK